MRTLCAIALLAASVAPAHADDAAIDALPLLAEIDGGPTPVRLRGHLDGKKKAAMIALARAVYTDVNRRFVDPRAGRPRRRPVDLVVFAADRDYRAFVLREFGEGQSPLGFYEPQRRVAVINLARGEGNLRHELAHPLLGDDFPHIPGWLNEGIGSLYGTATPGKDGRFRFLVNYRLRDLHRAMKDGTIPSLDELVLAGDDDLYGLDGMTYYAMSRYVLLYLEQQGRLDDFYRDVRAARGDQDTQRRLLATHLDDQRFISWARRLRYR